MKNCTIKQNNLAMPLLFIHIDRSYFML